MSKDSRLHKSRDFRITLYEILLGRRAIHPVSVDNIEDCIYKHTIINCKIRAFYDDWHTGEIMWYNTKLDEYQVLYEDSNEDYIKLDDINGIDMILIN